jgi:hypothetical protein
LQATAATITIFGQTINGPMVTTIEIKADFFSKVFSSTHATNTTTLTCEKKMK